MEEIHKFYNLNIEQRRKLISSITSVENLDINLTLSDLDKLTENVFTEFKLPMSIAPNFRINNKDYLVPMVIEEPSVVAAASKIATISKHNGGFTAESMKPVMIGEIFVRVPDIRGSIFNLNASKDIIKEYGNDIDPILVENGGGIEDIFAQSYHNDILIVHILVNVQDAMGANIVNTICEKLTPLLEDLLNGTCLYRIVSNLADNRIVKSSSVFGIEEIGGYDVAKKIIELNNLAMVDPYRKATHIKGIMNGIDALMIATGNDWRAVESSAYSYAFTNNTVLTNYYIDENNNLRGTIELPIPCGVIGGATSLTGKLGLKILNVNTSTELSKVAASLGLAQNLGALRALADEGIQSGHMKLARRHN